eukprot:358321-Chlamydomonas_euryale.AAC.2
MGVDPCAAGEVLFNRERHKPGGCHGHQPVCCGGLRARLLRCPRCPGRDRAGERWAVLGRGERASADLVNVTRLVVARLRSGTLPRLCSLKADSLGAWPASVGVCFCNCSSGLTASNLRLRVCGLGLDWLAGVACVCWRLLLQLQLGVGSQRSASASVQLGVGLVGGRVGLLNGA